MAKQLTGRALDALIAERVMGQVSCDGWFAYNLGAAGGMTLQKTCGHKSHECYPSKSVANAFGAYDGVPPYSRKIEAAMQVVDRLHERGMNFQLTDKHALDKHLWWVEFATPDGECGGQHFAATREEAICGAALEAARQLAERDAALKAVEGQKQS